jgi:hypothetical protein
MTNEELEWIKDTITELRHELDELEEIRSRTSIRKARVLGLIKHWESILNDTPKGG